MMTEADIKRIVKEAMRQEREDANEKFDITVLKMVAAVLNGFGIDEDEKKEIKEDFRYLRKFRVGSERITRYTLTAMITVVVGGTLSALWLGIKSLVGK